jgi:hypothetical protein
MDETVKTISMTHKNYAGDLGTLRVHRYMDLELSREMLFYELTWDPIIETEKQLLNFDNTAEASARRVPFNHTLKTFVNATVPDALMYNTKYRDPIQLSIGQAICWMLSKKWDELPSDGSASCVGIEEDYWSKVDASGIAIISHSMGSRISIDAMQTAVARFADRPNYREISAKAQTTPVYLYMLSNQLPFGCRWSPSVIRTTCSATPSAPNISIATSTRGCARRSPTCCCRWPRLQASSACRKSPIPRPRTLDTRPTAGC